MIDERTRDAIEASDTDDLLRVVDGMCAARNWDNLIELRLHLAAAGERGRQLWGVDEHIRYRLALEGPDDLAGEVVAGNPTRFALGPLTEVVAQNRTWEEIAPHLGSGPHREAVAHECAIRGERIDLVTHQLEIPIRIQDWEPRYPVAEYKSDRAEFPAPDQPTPRACELPGDPVPADDFETIEALSGLAATWVEESGGRAEARAVEGSALSAIAALGLSRAYMAPIDAAQAMAWMAWAAASGGAYGRRRGAGAGRFGAWWAAAALAGLDWPPNPDELGRTLDQFRWWIWSDGDDTGWTLRLAVEDPEHGLAWAVAAKDQTQEGLGS